MSTRLRDKVIKNHPYCAFCGATEDLEVHHILPKSLGGSDDESNYIVCCRKCHMEIMHKDNHSLLTKLGIQRAKNSPCHKFVDLVDICDWVVDCCDDGFCPDIYDLLDNVDKFRIKQVRV